MNSKVRSDFPVTQESVYLDTAYVSPTPLPVLNAGRAFLDCRSLGTAGRVEHWLGVMDEVRGSVGRLINASPTEIAFTTNTSDGTNFVAASVTTGPGGNVVIDDLDYPSNSAIWHATCRARNAEIRIVKARNGAATVEDFADFVDDDTAAISISHVSHRNGYRHDLHGLAELAHAHGAYLHVDGSQAIGALQLDVKACNVDFLTCGAYKWQLGPLGLAFFYVRGELLPVVESTKYGWMRVKTWTDTAHIVPQGLHESARKFESATVHFQGVFELKEAMNYIHSVGIETIERQVLRLSARLYQGLADLGFTIRTPPGEQSGIVTCQIDNSEKLERVLSEKRVVTTVRPSEMRISPHFFNTDDEIDTLLNVMEANR
jgi:cysteine desulfurase/selenocysteine lyase